MTVQFGVQDKTIPNLTAFPPALRYAHPEVLLPLLPSLLLTAQQTNNNKKHSTERSSSRGLVEGFHKTKAWRQDVRSSTPARQVPNIRDTEDSNQRARVRYPGVTAERAVEVVKKHRNMKA